MNKLDDLYDPYEWKQVLEREKIAQPHREYNIQNQKLYDCNNCSGRPGACPNYRGYFEIRRNNEIF